MPEPHALEAMVVAREAGYIVNILTARDWHPEGEHITRTWLTTHGIPYDNLHMVGLDASKADAISQMGDVRIFVDDNPHHIEQARYLVDLPILIDRPWNRSFPHLARVSSLEKVIPMLKIKHTPERLPSFVCDDVEAHR
jgi:uncharacterized HAD superfamily protein